MIKSLTFSSNYGEDITFCRFMKLLMLVTKGIIVLFRIQIQR